jgi:DNA repair exonuclease SbcCD nuclease subunit
VVVKILATSDWHLDATTAGFDRFDDVSEAIEEAISVAVAERVDLFVFLGDLCDPDANRAPRCVAKAIDVAQRLRNKMIPSRWLVGNLDVIEDGSGTSTLAPLAAAASAVGSVNGPEWVRVVSSPGVEEIGGAGARGTLWLRLQVPLSELGAARNQGL